MYIYSKAGLNSAVHAFQNFINQTAMINIKLTRAREAFASMHGFNTYAAMSANPQIHTTNQATYEAYCAKHGWVHPFGFSTLPLLSYSPIFFEDFFPTHVFIDKKYSVYLTISIEHQTQVHLSARIIEHSANHLQGWIWGESQHGATNVIADIRVQDEMRSTELVIEDLIQKIHTAAEHQGHTVSEDIVACMTATVTSCIEKPLTIKALDVSGVSDNEAVLESTLNLEYLPFHEEPLLQYHPLTMDALMKTCSDSPVMALSDLKSRLATLPGEYFPSRAKHIALTVACAIVNESNEFNVGLFTNLLSYQGICLLASHIKDKSIIESLRHCVDSGGGLSHPSNPSEYTIKTLSYTEAYLVQVLPKPAVA
jgi:hypothetical protein